MLCLKVYVMLSFPLCDVILFTEPHVPYTVGVQAFTHVGGGIIETQTVFSQEGGMQYKVALLMASEASFLVCSKARIFAIYFRPYVML